MEIMIFNGNLNKKYRWIERKFQQYVFWPIKPTEIDETFHPLQGIFLRYSKFVPSISARIETYFPHKPKQIVLNCVTPRNLSNLAQNKLFNHHLYPLLIKTTWITHVFL